MTGRGFSPSRLSTDHGCALLLLVVTVVTCALLWFVWSDHHAHREWLRSLPGGKIDLRVEQDARGQP